MVCFLIILKLDTGFKLKIGNKKVSKHLETNDKTSR